MSDPNLIAAADAICRRLNSEIARSDKGAREIVRVARLNEALENRAVKELSKLEPTPVLASEWRKFLTLRAALAHELGVLAAAARRGRPSTVQQSISAKRLLHNMQRASATGMGFSDCAQLG